MRVMRINFSHATFEEAELRLTNLRAVSLLSGFGACSRSLTLASRRLVEQSHTKKTFTTAVSPHRGCRQVVP